MCVRGQPWPSKNGLSDKGRAIKELVVWNSWDVIALGPAKRS